MSCELGRFTIADCRHHILQIFTIHHSLFITMITLTEGSKAPAFKAKDQNGKEVSLAYYKGQKIILFFYPEDDTPTCTIQACNLRDNYGLLRKNGFVVLGVSPDEEKKT